MTANSERRSRANAACACDTNARKAVAVDPEIKAANRHRLRRIEGQIRGLQKARTSSPKSPACRKRCAASRVT